MIIFIKAVEKWRF